MRRTALALLAALTLTTTSCSSDEPADAKPSPARSVTPDEQFMTAVRDADFPSYAEGLPPAGELTAFPPQWCKALETGHTVQWMLGEGDMYPIGQTWGTRKDDAFQLVLLASRAYCPEWSDEVRDDLRFEGEH